MEIGTVVRLKSGGPAMTVVGHGGPNDDSPYCQWFAGKEEPFSWHFPPAALVKVEPEIPFGSGFGVDITDVLKRPVSLEQPASKKAE